MNAVTDRAVVAMACGKTLVIVLVTLCSSWYPRAEAADGEGECISGFGPVTDPVTPIDQRLQVIIPSFQFNDSGKISAFHLGGNCAGGEPGVGPSAYIGTVQHCINILQVWRPSGGNWFSIAANFTATLTVTYATLMATSVAVDEPIPFSSGDVLGFSPGADPGFYFNVATSSLQPASHTYYTYSSFATELSTTSGNRVVASPIISVEVECCPSTTLEPPEPPSSSSSFIVPSSSVEQAGSSLVTSPSQLPGASGDGISGTLPATSTAASMEEQSPQAPASSSPSATNQPASDPTSSSPVVSTSVATTASILSTSGGQGESDANAGLVAGVVVGVVLAMVMAVVVAAIVLTLCSVRWRRNKKYAPSCNVTNEVPYHAYIAANSNAEPAQYKMMPFSNRKGTSNGEYDVPCQMEELEHTIGPRCYEVPSPSTLPPSFEAVLGANTKENVTLQGETHYNMGCHDDGMLCNPTATSTNGNESVEQHPIPIYGFVPTVMGDSLASTVC